ncbi:hypothetical protein PG985_008935 [Apiospora marii]|uniref:uncharacterized protein n=1 Tax=Apiospora marii TaxID=335849 RepID=UPI00312F793F
MPYPISPGEAMYLVEFTKELRDFDQFYAELTENGISATPKENWTYPILYGATFYALEVSKTDVAKTLTGMEHAKEWWSWPDAPLRMSPGW